VAEDEESDVFLLSRACAQAQIPSPLVVVRDGEGVVHYLTGAPPFQERARHPLPGLILLDLKMPRMTGFDVLVWIQSHPEFCHTPVVILTSSDDDRDREKALALGARQFLVKPCSIQDLVQTMKQLQAQWLDGREPCACQP
jgi:CheY-like chemotaxis protein